MYLWFSSRFNAIFIKPNFRESLKSLRKRCFQMTINLSIYTIQIPRLIDWLRYLAPVFQPAMRRKRKTQKPIAPCMHHFSPALSRLQVIAGNCDWFIVLFAPVVTGWSNYFGLGFSTVIWKPLYCPDRSLLNQIEIIVLSFHKWVLHCMLEEFYYNCAGNRKFVEKMYRPMLTRDPAL